MVELPADAGPAAARNAGVAATTSELVAFVDADVVVEAEALARLRARFAADPGLAAVFGSYDDTPAAPGTVSRFRNLLHHHVHASSPGPAETFWAGLGAVRREALERAGGFDAERFPEAAIEDVELGMRLRRAGAAIVLDPEVRGTHLKRWSLRSMVDTDLRRRGAPVDAPAARARRELERAQPRLASPAQRGRLRRPRRGRRSRGGHGPPWRRSRGWSRSTTVSTLCSPAAAERGWRRAGSPCTSSTT